MLVDIANEQFIDGNEVAILVVNKTIDESVRDRIASGVKLFTMNRSRSSKNPLPLFKLLYLLKFTFRADVIHVHDPEIGKLIRLFCRTPMVLTVHNTKMDPRHMVNYRKIFAISNTVKHDVESRSNLKCKIVFNGIKIRDIKEKSSFATPPVFRIVLVKRLDHTAKGQDLLIRALDVLINRKGIGNVRLDLAGEGPSRDFIQNLILDSRLQDYVFLLGNKSREWVYENLCKYDLFVHPSRFEGFGLAVAEAMAAKLPVITSNIEGPAEILENGKHGLTFENDNFEDLAKQIEQAMELYKNGTILKLIDSAYKHCSANFNISRTAREYCENYF